MSSFIVIEGIDGSGKTTLVRNLANRFREDGLKVFDTFEPTKKGVGAMVRERLNEKKGVGDDVQKWAEFEMLLAADRMNHLHSEIRPRLADHDIVICDRYLGSGYAYGITSRPQGMSHSEAFFFLRTLYQYALMPDLTLFVDVSTRTSMERVRARGGELSRYDEDTQFLIRTSNEYHGLASRFGWENMDAEGFSPEDATREAYRIIGSRLK